MAPHSSTLAWKLPWTEEPGRLQSMGSLESDMAERLHFHFSLSCSGEGNGNPLHCSCLESPGMGEPGGLPSMGSHRVGHDWSDLAAVVYMGFPGGSDGKESACRFRRPKFNSWVGKIPLEEGMATPSSILAWRIPWTEEPGGLQSMGSQRVSTQLRY